MSLYKDALWAAGHDESVEVNQRALIDKVLARYSGEFSVFRELLQNSDDASSSAVEIHFETEAFLKSKTETDGGGASAGGVLPDLKTTAVHQWTFKNNGLTFRDEDWNRLKKIAEGNPDEEKIGAFGVGFYSLFSVTEDPFVTSGGQWMGFYWKDKKDQLFARRGVLPPNNKPPNQWTCFEMVLREPSPIPPAFDFSRFLASSIVFMTHLTEVSVYFDNHRLVKLSKSAGSPQTLSIPRGLHTSSPAESMTVKSIQATPLHINADVMRLVYSSGTEKPPLPTALKPVQKPTGFFSSLLSSFTGTPATPSRPLSPLSPPSDPTINLQIVETTITLSIFSAEIQVRLGKKVADELLRATKKKPPSKIKYELIYTGKDDYDASKKQDEVQAFSTGSVFQGLRADVEGGGTTRIFVGHSTAQTTGIGGHMASRFIPTVERESLDLMDKNVAFWNKELLFVGGFLSRCAYEFEMDTIRTLWEGADQSSTIEPSLRTWLINRAIHALKFFTFRQSTPSAEVASQLEAAFFGCSARHQFPLISSVGVRQISDIRLPEAKLSSFLKFLPVVTPSVLDEASLMITSLQNRSMISPITSEDVLKELHARPLNIEEMIACLQWYIDLNKLGEDPRLPAFRIRFLSEALLTDGASGSPDNKIIPLSSINLFINAKGSMGAHIPQDGPLPNTLLPTSISCKFPAEHLVAYFPWKELTILGWLRHVCDPAIRSTDIEYDIERSPFWAERVLTILQRSWSSVPNTDKTEVSNILNIIACIPTSQGHKCPGDAYFANANVLGDLPTVALPSGAMIKGPMERLLQYLGVRKYVDLQIVFTRMIKTGNWKVEDLIRYLVSVEKELRDEDWERLRVTPIFSQEGISSQGGKPKRYRADQLYEPLDIFRQLRLPTIAWGTDSKWRSSAADTKLLFRIGLLRAPPLPELINLCASSDPSVSSAALKYLLDNMSTRYTDYDPKEFVHIAYIPANNGALSCLGTPLEVFSDRQWTSLGFLVLAESMQPYVSRLKIPRHPATSQLIQLLRTSPPSPSQAKEWFSVLSTRLSDFSDAELTVLSNIPFVPVPDNAGSAKGIFYASPKRCLLDTNTGQLQSKLFTCVDFGTAGNSFLSACGTKHEASVEELAQILLSDPRKFYNVSGGPEYFLNELRNIAINKRLLSSNTFTRLSKSPVLLGVKRRLKESTNNKTQDLDDDEWESQYDLLVPSSIAIVDDTNNYQLFGDALFTAPQEDILESFYAELGSRRLSSLVKPNYRPTQEVRNVNRSFEMRNLILQRLPLFLHGQTHARLRVPLNWLNTDGNFVVKFFGKIGVYFNLTFGEIRTSRIQEASAVSKRDGYGPIQLWLAYNMEVDMYEVATSLSRLFFEGAKANDTLLFMTILSTDLKSLKRRGYNVDRILQQQKHAKEAALESQQEKTRRDGTPAPVHSSVLEKPSSTPRMIDRPEPTPVPGTFPESSSLPKGKKASNFFKSIQDLRHRVASRPHTPEQESLSGDITPPPIPDKPRPGPSNARPSNGANVTPLSNIDSNINMAIRACRPENGDLVRNKEEMRQVKESMNDGYCDVSGRAGDLNLVGEMGVVKIFVTADIYDTQAFLSTKRDRIARFIHIMSPLAEVYSLPLSSLHIFYDLGGDLIAFNRNASIFLNMRYFEAWHHDDVQHGKLDEAFISWYFTLAHEIAHNLVQPHNSEHEFYFSAICEKHIKSLGRLISTTPLAPVP